MVREKDLVWLAGFFDGAGSIGISRSPSGYQGNVWVSQKNLDILTEVVNIVFHCNLPLPWLSTSVSGVGILEFDGNKGAELLKELLPYLRHPFKISRAEFYILFYQLDSRVPGGKEEKEELFSTWPALREVTK